MTSNFSVLNSNDIQLRFTYVLYEARISHMFINKYIFSHSNYFRITLQTAMEPSKKVEIGIVGEVRKGNEKKKSKK